MQARQLFQALSAKQGRKSILLNPSWDVLCSTLTGTVDASTGTSHLLRAASVTEHEWLLGQIESEIVNEETFSAIFKVVITWRIVRTLGLLRAMDELWQCMRLTSCCAPRAAAEAITMTMFHVWVDIEGEGIAFQMNWREPSLHTLESSQIPAEVINADSEDVDHHGRLPVTTSLPLLSPTADNSRPDRKTLPAVSSIGEEEGITSSYTRRSLAAPLLEGGDEDMACNSPSPSPRPDRKSLPAVPLVNEKEAVSSGSTRRTLPDLPLQGGDEDMACHSPPPSPKAEAEADASDGIDATLPRTKQRKKLVRKK
jgi:hypothetical protein